MIMMIMMMMMMMITIIIITNTIIIIFTIIIIYNYCYYCKMCVQWRGGTLKRCKWFLYHIIIKSNE